VQRADGVGAGGDAGVRRRRSRRATRSGSAPAPAGDAPLLDGAADVHVGRARRRRSGSPAAGAAAEVVGAGVRGERRGVGALAVAAGGLALRWRLRQGFAVATGRHLAVGRASIGVGGGRQA